MEDTKRCYYCDQDKGFRSLLLKICDLRASSVFLCKGQTLAGRYTIMFRDHCSKLFKIPKTERDGYVDDVCALAWTVKGLFGADRINYAIYGGEVTHVRYTLCPKYEGRLGWGGPFMLFPEEKGKTTLTDKQYREWMELIRKTVVKKGGIRL